MNEKTTNTQSDSLAVGWMIRGLVFVTILAAFLVPMGGLPIIAIAPREDGEPVAVTGPITYRLTTPIPGATSIPPTSTPDITKVGIVIGHSGINPDGLYDPGTHCESDGLQEVQVNTQIARHVQQLGEARGWQIELLDEYDAKLPGYQADVLISIHADSCDDQFAAGLSGYKIARYELSSIPDEEDRLKSCIMQSYEGHTGLEFHHPTVTNDMKYYRVFTIVAPETPAVIIETGFMLEDRVLLTEHQDVVAQGIVDGLACFLEGSE